jgi:lysyl-tRNA synthetase class 2
LAGLGLEAEDRSADMQVESTAIREIDYDDSHEKLYVTFSDGDAYVYVGVPGDVHRSFLDADSKGRFFAYEIRDRYPYNRLTG